MKPSFELVNKILKSLPISYYLKRKVSLVLSKNSIKSQIDLMTDSIIISYKSISCYDIPNEELESHIRAILYHEISHAMLSPIPKNLTIDKEIYNTFEDERIETINQNTFIDVDFKKTLSVISPIRIALTPKETFFNLVRYRIGSEEELKLVDFIIKKYSHLRYSPSPQNIEDYLNDINMLYQSITSPKEFVLSEGYQNWHSNITSSNQTFEEGKDEHLNSDIFNYYDNQEFYKKVKSIFESKKLERGNNATSRISYSGKINPKSINKPNDNYKWWTNQGDGFLKEHRKLCLNLFIDQSGSFKVNEDKTNSMLKELSKIEKEYPNFIFNLITIDTDINISNERKLSCSGANSLTSKVKVIVQKVLNKNNENINIILFDGIAIDKEVIDPITNQVLPKYSDLQARNFQYFNLPNTIIISNLSNKEYLDKYCYSTKIIYTSNYLEELEDNIFRSLQKLISRHY